MSNIIRSDIEDGNTLEACPEEVLGDADELPRAIPKGGVCLCRIAAKPSLSERRGARRPLNSDATNAGVYGRAGRERPSSVPAAVRMHGTRPLSSADAMCAGTNGSLVKKADRPVVPIASPADGWKIRSISRRRSSRRRRPM